MATTETFITLSRGLKEHIPHMSDSAFKLYIYLLLIAGWQEKNKGKTIINQRELAKELNMSKTTVHKSIKELTPKYISYQPAKNQYQVTEVSICKFKTISDFAVLKSGTAPDQHPTSTRPAPDQHGYSELQKQAPNKVNKVNNNISLYREAENLANNGEKKLLKKLHSISNFPTDPLTTLKYLQEKLEEYPAEVVVSAVESFSDKKNYGEPLTKSPLGQLTTYIKNEAKGGFNETNNRRVSSVDGRNNSGKKKFYRKRS